MASEERLLREKYPLFGPECARLLTRHTRGAVRSKASSLGVHFVRGLAQDWQFRLLPDVPFKAPKKREEKQLPPEIVKFRRRCEVCGKLFTSRDSRKRYCSDWCRKSKTEGRSSYKLVCVCCGSPFEASHPNAKYCSPSCARRTRAKKD